MKISSIFGGGLPPMPGGDGPVDGGLRPGSMEAWQSDAPKKIESEDIVFFEAECAFETLANAHRYDYVYGYAAKVDGGAIAALSTATGGRFAEGNEKYTAVALVDNGVFRELQEIVARHDFAKNNGASHFINGLPENFGGKVCVNYASGEKISYDDNQCPVMSPDAGEEIAAVLKKYIEKKSIRPLKVKNITAVEYRRDNDEYNYEHMRLEGSVLKTKAQYGKDQIVFDKQYEVPADSMDKIRTLADENALLYWTGMYEFDWDMYKDRAEQIIFTMKDGSEIAVREAMRNPAVSRSMVFEVHMYLNELKKK